MPKKMVISERDLPLKKADLYPPPTWTSTGLNWRLNEAARFRYGSVDFFSGLRPMRGLSDVVMVIFPVEAPNPALNLTPKCSKNK